MNILRHLLQDQNSGIHDAKLSFRLKYLPFCRVFNPIYIPINSNFNSSEMSLAVMVSIGLSSIQVRLSFLRKALGFSLKDWADHFGLTAAGVLKWERARDKRLAPVNEAAVRAICAEHLGVVFEGIWSELIANDKTPKKVSVKLPLAA